jgi:ribosomal protein S27AE
MKNNSMYQRAISSSHWYSLKQQKEIQSNGKCERCGVSKYSLGLELHHKHYKTLGREKISDVELLCQRCHKEADQERRLLSGRFMNRYEFLDWLSEQEGLSPTNVPEAYLMNKYADYINLLYLKRVSK